MIQLLRGTQSQLNSYSTIIPDGQPVFERDTGQLKIGTGSARYSSLPYVGSIFESSGGGDTGMLAGDSSEGYADFPNGLRVCWGNEVVQITTNWVNESETGFVITRTNTRFYPSNVKSTILSGSFVSTAPPVRVYHATFNPSSINLYFIAPYNQSGAVIQYTVLSM